MPADHIGGSDSLNSPPDLMDWSSSNDSSPVNPVSSHKSQQGANEQVQLTRRASGASGAAEAAPISVAAAVQNELKRVRRPRQQLP